MSKEDKLPFGYRYVIKNGKRVVAINTKEAKIVKATFEKYLAG